MTLSQSSPVPSGPIARIEKGTLDVVWHSASAAAIFVGCCSNMSLACWSPLRATPTPEITMTMTPRTTAGR